MMAVQRYESAQSNNQPATRKKNAGKPDPANVQKKARLVAINEHGHGIGEDH
jgi:hypothetical protein